MLKSIHQAEAKKAALEFLRRTASEAARHADAIDPKRKRDYGHDSVLRGLDAVSAAASRALHASGESA